MTQPSQPLNENANGNAGNQQQNNASNDSGIDLSKIDSVEKLPKWAQDELSRARNDAASYRNRLRDAKNEVEAEVKQSVQSEVEKLKTELSDLKGQLASVEIDSIKLDAALEVGVPGEHLKAFASRLQGSTAEEIKADAEAAKALFNLAPNAGSRATDPTAGLGGNQPNKTPESAFGDFVIGKLSR